MATYINTKDIIGEQATLDGLIEHSLTEFVDSDVSILGTSAFASNNNIKKIVLQNLTSIGQYCFEGCYSLSELHVGIEKTTICSIFNGGSLNEASRCIIFVPSNLVDAYKSNSKWSSLVNRIYAEGDPDAPTWSESEITDTEAEIAARVNNGTAANYYKLGQYKSVNFGSLGTLRMQIIAKNTDELTDGSGYAQLTWFPMELTNAKHRMNPYQSAGTEGTGNIGGWGKSEMRSYLYNDVWPLIPSTWKDIIKEVKKYTRILNTSGQVENDVLTNDKIWLLSATEANCGYSNYQETLGPRYSLCFNNEVNKIRKMNFVPTIWFLRTARSSGSFFTVTENGYSQESGGGGTAGNENGVAFGFCT